MRFFNQVWLIACLSVLGVARSQAQSSSPSTAPYLLFKVGYSLPDSPQSLGSIIVINPATQTGQLKGVYGSYAQGINLSVGLGKMLNPTFGFEGSAELCLGKKIISSYEFPDASGSQIDHARSLILKPMIVIRNSGDLLTIYSKLGLAVAVTSKLYHQEEGRDIAAGTYTTYESTENVSVKVGFAAGFGLAFRVAESFSLLVEVNGQLLSLPVRNGHYTKFEKNGIDQLPSMEVVKKEWVYEKNLPTEFPPNEPAKKVFAPTYFSYVGVGVGIMYHL